MVQEMLAAITQFGNRLAKIKNSSIQSVNQLPLPFANKLALSSIPDSIKKLKGNNVNLLIFIFK